MTGSNSTLIFELTFYHHVKYAGYCPELDRKYFTDGDFKLPNPMVHFAPLLLSVLAITFNGISFFIFMSDEFGYRMFKRSANSTVSASDKTSSTVTTIQSTQRRGSVVQKSCVTLSLLLLSLSECLFNLGAVILTLLVIITPHIISQKVSDSSEFEQTIYHIRTLPVVQNGSFFLLDMSLLCRNWCVCLITLARAEVVLWPIPSKPWQRILRTRRRFGLAYLSVVVIAIILSYIRHADMVGQFCFHRELKMFVLWMEEFLLTKTQKRYYDVFGFNVFQIYLVWILIVCFTVVIVVRLQPWKKGTGELGNLSSTSAGQMSGAQVEGLKQRRKGQLRATRMVIAIAVLFLICESLIAVIHALETSGILEPDSHLIRKLEPIANSMVTIDSIFNFFVFMMTVRQFRAEFFNMFCSCFLSRRSRRTQNSSTSETANTSHSMFSSNSNRLQLD